MASSSTQSSSLLDTTSFESSTTAMMEDNVSGALAEAVSEEFATTSYSSAAHHSFYSYEQQRILFWAPKLPAFVSMMSSMLIAYILLRDRKQRLTKVFGRLWLGLSLGNVFITTMVLLGSITAPSSGDGDSGDAYYSYGNYGNHFTCTMSGAIFHFVFVSTMIYNGASGVYYYISVHTSWSDEYVKSRIEPWMHAVGILYPLVGAIIGIILDMYHPNKLFQYCWVSDVDDNHGTVHALELYEYGDEEAVSHVHTQRKYRAVFTFLSGLIEFNQFTACKLSSMFAIAYTVSKQQQLMKTKYGGGSGGGGGATPTTTTTTNGNVNGSTDTNNNGTVVDNSNNDANNNTSSSRRSSSGNNNNSRNNCRGRSTLARQAYIQSVLFTGACIIPYGCTILIRLLDLFWENIPSSSAPTGFFIFSLIGQTLFPLQGVFNLVIFFRPRYLHRRRMFEEEETKWESIKSLLVRRENVNNTRRLRGRKSGIFTIPPTTTTPTKSSSRNPITFKTSNNNDGKDKATTSRRSSLFDMGSRSESLFLGSMFKRGLVTTAASSPPDEGESSAIKVDGDNVSNTDATTQPPPKTDLEEGRGNALLKTEVTDGNAVAHSHDDDVERAEGTNENGQDDDDDEEAVATSSSSDDATPTADASATRTTRRPTTLVDDDDIVVVVGEDLAQDVLNIVAERRRNRRRRIRGGGGRDHAGHILGHLDNSIEDLMDGSSSLDLTPSLLMGPQPDLKFLR